MTTKQLLSPRYKVVANYPNSSFKIGDIIEMGGSKIYNNDLKALFDPSLYTEIFYLLQWYECRDKKYMPLFLKNKKNKSVHKVNRYSRDNYYVYLCGKGYKISTHKFMPATKAMYIKYQINNP